MTALVWSCHLNPGLVDFVDNLYQLLLILIFPKQVILIHLPIPQLFEFLFFESSTFVDHYSHLISETG